MSTSSNAYLNQAEQQQDQEYDRHMIQEEQAYAGRAPQVILSPDAILVLSKENVKDFHGRVKQRIKDTGDGLMEYLEVIKFFEKLKDVISGDSQSKDPAEKEGDKELKQMVRDEVAKWNGKYTTPRGVKFENAETGTKYNYSICNDQSLLLLEIDAKAAAEKLKERQEFLKKLPVEGVEIRQEDELVRIYPPSKSSTSSYKITLPK